MFLDRADAGRRLAEALRDRATVPPGRPGVVLGIPRGGVVVAAEVARELGLPLDVALARKVGAPGNPELAVGAVGPDGRAFIDESLARRIGADTAFLEQAVATARAEVTRRLEAFRAGRPAVDVAGRVVIVVDDGVATGSTAAAVGNWLRGTGAGWRVLAVPVGAPPSLGELGRIYDELVVLAAPAGFFAVGEWYRDFTQVTDDEVRRVLEEAASSR